MSTNRDIVIVKDIIFPYIQFTTDKFKLVKESFEKLQLRENEDIEFIVAVHELIEMWLTKKRGIQEPDITKFDIESGLDDPGESKDAPYHKEHMFAVEVEKILCKELGISYEDYYNAQPYGSTDTNK